MPDNGASVDRWVAFTDDELTVLWREIVFDDGIMYRPNPGSLEFALLGEIEREWVRRGRRLDITLTGAA